MLKFIINTTGKANQLAIFDKKTKLAEYISKESEKRGGSEKLKTITENLLKKANKQISEIGLMTVNHAR